MMNRVSSSSNHQIDDDEIELRSSEREKHKKIESIFSNLFVKNES